MVYFETSVLCFQFGERRICLCRFNVCSSFENGISALGSLVRFRQYVHYGGLIMFTSYYCIWSEGLWFTCSAYVDSMLARDRFQFLLPIHTLRCIYHVYYWILSWGPLFTCIVYVDSTFARDENEISTLRFFGYGFNFWLDM